MSGIQKAHCKYLHLGLVFRWSDQLQGFARSGKFGIQMVEKRLDAKWSTTKGKKIKEKSLEKETKLTKEKKRQKARTRKK